MVEIITKIIKSERPLRVTPPKNKKNKKLRERVGAVGAVGIRGGWGILLLRAVKKQITKRNTCNTLIYNYLLTTQMLFFTYNTDVLHKKGEKGIIFIYIIRYIDIIYIL